MRVYVYKYVVMVYCLHFLVMMEMLLMEMGVLLFVKYKVGINVQVEIQPLRLYALFFLTLIFRLKLIGKIQPAIEQLSH